jgi:hypothetical protein
MRPDSGTPKKSAYWLKGIFRKNRVTGLGALQQMVLDAGFYNFPGPSKKNQCTGLKDFAGDCRHADAVRSYCDRSTSRMSTDSTHIVRVPFV